MVEEKEWHLIQGKRIESSSPISPSRNWLERLEHTPEKILFCDNGVVCMASATAITMHSWSNDADKGPIFEPATHVINVTQPATCLAFGFSQYVTSYGVRSAELVPIIASGHVNGNICIWHAVTSKLITRLLSHSGWVNRIEISLPSNGQTQILSVSQDRTLKVWDFENNGYNMSQTVSFPCPIYALAWSPHGRMVACGGSSQKIFLYEKELGGLIKSSALKYLTGHLHNVINLRFFPDNAILVSASLDGRILMWDPCTSDVKQIISLHFPLPHYVFPSYVTGFEISRSGHAFLSLSDKGRLCLWNTMSMQLRMSDPDCILNVTPQEEISLGDDTNYRSIKLAKCERSLFLPTFDSSLTQVVSLRIPAPPLKHLCRLVVRQLIPNSTQLCKLQLPKQINDYLSYNTW